MELARRLSRLAQNDLEQPINKQFQPMFAAIQRDFNAAQANLKATLVEHLRERRRGFVGRQGDRLGVGGSVASHRAAGGEPGGDLGGARRRHRDGQEDRGRLGAGARPSSARARANAEKSGDVVRRAVEAMGRIEKSSQQISQIIGVIDEIAFQTNLLALNAGVEAARAGDAGRGFAVVASEVRALAQRSAEAAKEIKALIGTSSAEVSGGVKLVAETGEALTQIIDQVGQVNALVGEIASGAEEQATSLHEVNAAVNADGRGDPAERRHGGRGLGGGFIDAARGHPARRDLIGQFRLGRNRSRPRVARRTETSSAARVRQTVADFSDSRQCADACQRSGARQGGAARAPRQSGGRRRQLERVLRRSPLSRIGLPCFPKRRDCHCTQFQLRRLRRTPM